MAGSTSPAGSAWAVQGKQILHFVPERVTGSAISRPLRLDANEHIVDEPSRARHRYES